MADINVHIEKLQKQIADNQKEIDQIRRLQEKFPDLKLYVGRWEKKAFCAASANAKTTDYESRYNCGCCSDSPLEIWTYLETPEGDRIYSDPTGFFVGRRSGWSGAIADPGWKEQLRKYNIPESLIEKIGLRLRDEDSEEDNDNDL